MSFKESLVDSVQLGKKLSVSQSIVKKEVNKGVCTIRGTINGDTLKLFSSSHASFITPLQVSINISELFPYFPAASFIGKFLERSIWMNIKYQTEGICIFNREIYLD